jgi:hypothetical protein
MLIDDSAVTHNWVTPGSVDGSSNGTMTTAASPALRLMLSPPVGPGHLDQQLAVASPGRISPVLKLAFSSMPSMSDSALRLTGAYLTATIQIEFQWGGEFYVVETPESR